MAYEGEIPDDIRAAFNAGIDKCLASELDPGLLGDLIAFYEAHL